MKIRARATALSVAIVVIVSTVSATIGVATASSNSVLVCSDIKTKVLKLANSNKCSPGSIAISLGLPFQPSPVPTPTSTTIFINSEVAKYLSAYDSTGKNLGPVLAVGDINADYVSVLVGQHQLIYEQSTGKVGGQDELTYLNSTCTGQGYVGIDPNLLGTPIPKEFVRLPNERGVHIVSFNATYTATQQSIGTFIGAGGRPYYHASTLDPSTLQCSSWEAMWPGTYSGQNGDVYTPNPSTYFGVATFTDFYTDAVGPITVR